MRLFIIAVLLLPFGLTAQSLSFYADVMINADEAQNRQFASEEFNKLFEEELNQPTSLTKSYSDLKWISIQYPQDSMFRTLTWQVDLGNGRYAYHGYLQTHDSKLFKIAGPRGQTTHESNKEMPIDAWRGALIYKILQIPELNDMYYLLTFRMLNQHTKVKTLEPLSLVGDKATLGKFKHFVSEQNTGQLHARLSLIYSADSNASITYEPASNRFVFDNLVVVAGRMQGQGTTAVPDGSYKAFELTDKSWVYKDKLYDEVNSGPLRKGPRPKSNQIVKPKRKRG